MGNSEIAKRDQFSADDLRSIASFDDAIRLLQGGGIDLHDATEVIGDGFTMLDDKSKLVDVPCVILQWLFTPGDYGQDFVVARVVTQNGDRYIVTDGSTGMCLQLRDYEQRTGKTAGLILPRGLRKSEYDIDADGQPTRDKDKAEGKGITYYLNV